MASLPADAFALTKRQLRAPALARIREGRTTFDPVIQKLWAAPATVEGVRRYIERTLKKFPVVLYLAFGDVRSLGFQLLLQPGQHHVLN